MKIRTLPAALGLALVAAAGQAQPAARPAPRAQARTVVATPPPQHVLLISVDGLHALDLENYIKAHPTSTLAQLAGRGVRFPNASCTRPSDSFPGLLALLTGGSPKTVGVYYDVSYDRSLLPPTNPGYLSGADPTSGGGAISYLGAGVPGTQANYDEFIEKDFRRLDGGGGLDPTRLPRDLQTGLPVLPHNFVRANTVFQIARAGGLPTAWSDKHVAAYDIVNGNDAYGPGVNDYYSPEIAAYLAVVPDATGKAAVDARGLYSVVDSTNAAAAGLVVPQDGSTTGTSSVLNTEAYDDLKVGAILNEIGGKDHTGAGSAPVPAIFGMNFQVVSVGEKLNTEPAPSPGAATDALVGGHGGYLDVAGTPGPLLSNALDYINSRLGMFVAELNARGLTGSTTIVITAKHGQSPINLALLRKKKRTATTVQDPSSGSQLSSAGTGTDPGGDPANPTNDPQSLAAFVQTDDVALIWLRPATPLADAVKVLNTNRVADGLQTILSGSLLGYLYGDPATDPRTPSIIGVVNPGVIYSSGSKIAEHGGFSHDDTNVALLVVGAGVTPGVNTQYVQTKQVAPTILRLLGLPQSLTAAQTENTQTLPGF